MSAAPAPSPAEQAVIDRFGIFAEEESVDLTPGVVWTDSQLVVLRHLTAELSKTRAKVPPVEAAPEPEEIRVERVARAICDGDAEDHGTYTWAEASELDRGELQDDYRRSARHAIAAMESR